MSATVQFVVVGLIVAAAAGYVMCAAWKTWFGKPDAGCGSGCGKCAAAPEPAQEGRFPLPQVRGDSECGTNSR